MNGDGLIIISANCVVVIIATTWIVSRLSTLATKVTALEDGLARLSKLEDKRHCETHEADIQNLKERLDRVAKAK